MDCGEIEIPWAETSTTKTIKQPAIESHTHGMVARERKGGRRLIDECKKSTLAADRFMDVNRR